MMKLNVVSLFFSCTLVSIVLCMVSKSFLIMWLSFELVLFSMIPVFLVDHKQLEGFYYFFVQVLGSFIFLLGLCFQENDLVILIGILMKLGVFPFFWWVVYVVSNISWQKMFIVTVILKIPGYLVFRHLGDMKINYVVIGLIITFIFCSVMMYESWVKIKLLVSYSSMMKSTMLLVLSCFSETMMLIYFMLYSFSMLLVCGSFFGEDKLFIFGVSNKKIMGLIFLFFFTGIPPIWVFLYKILSFLLLSDFFYSSFFFILFMLFGMFLSSLAYLWLFLVNLMGSFKNFQMSYSFLLFLMFFFIFMVFSWVYV